MTPRNRRLIAVGIALIALPSWTIAINAQSNGERTFRLQTASVADINAAFDARALTSERLVELCIARIEAYDQKGPKLNAVIAINPNAIAEAKALDEERSASGPRSPIHGIPVLLKDNYDTYDMPTTGASKALIGSMAPDDATTVKKLREAGAVILAKVNLSELARSGVSISSLMGQTLNAYDQSRTPGGSSGGTGSAIAATFGILGTGSDTGQSTRSPASANSGVGIRPTYGLISRDGIIPISYTQDTAGPITRYVADAAAMMDHLVGFDYKDPSTYVGVGQAPESYTNFLDKDGLKGARIGYVTELFGAEPIHEEVTAVTMKAVKDLEAAGATVFPVSVPMASDEYREANPMGVGGFEYKHYMDRYFETLGPDRMYKGLAEFAATGLIHPPTQRSVDESVAKGDDAIIDPNYEVYLKRQAAFKAHIVEIMDKENIDALFFTHQKRLVVPATADPDQVDRNGFMASLTGLPAITFPGGFSAPSEDAPIGVPIGVEFLGRPFDEPNLIKFAYAFEQITKHRKPPEQTPDLPGEVFTY